jgi:DNA-binding winged helix-turn-helix (wHTH) protein
MRYVFGDFVLDDGTRQLLQAGREVPLGGKGFELLEMLVRARPQALSRTRLVATLWPQTHVGVTSLHTLVSQVRGALGDDSQDPHWIRTVHRFGYAFRGEASEEGVAANRLPPAPARSRLVAGERAWELPEGDSVVGRGENALVRIEKSGVSRHHARLQVRGGQVTIEDLGSKNGTFVADERITAPRALADGDVIGLGRQVRMVFRQSRENVTETEASPPS